MIYRIVRFSNADSDELSKEKEKLEDMKKSYKTQKKKAMRDGLVGVVGSGVLGGMVGEIRGVSKSTEDLKNRVNLVVDRVINDMSVEDKAKFSNTDPLLLSKGLNKLHEPIRNKIIIDEMKKGALIGAGVSAAYHGAKSGYKLSKAKKNIKAQEEKVRELEESSKK